MNDLRKICILLTLVLAAGTILGGCAAPESSAPEPPPATEPEPSATTPTAGDLFLDEGKLYVALERRNGFSADGNGQVLIIDVDTDTVVETITLQHKHPQSLAAYGGKLYVACSGEFEGEESGAVEAVDLATGETSTLLTEQDLDGTPLQLVQGSGPIFYIRTSERWGNVQVKRVDLSTGEILGELPGIENAEALYYDTEEAQLWVGDRGQEPTAAAVKVYDAEDEIVIDSISTPLPPYSLVRVGSEGEKKTVFVGSDYESGVLARNEVGSKELDNVALSVHQNSVLCSYDDAIYVLERLGAENVVKYDPGEQGEAAVVYRVHLGAGTHPVDMELLSGEKAYISLENRPEILVFNPEIGEIVSRIDFSKAAPPG